MRESQVLPLSLPAWNLKRLLSEGCNFWENAQLSLEGEYGAGNMGNGMPLYYYIPAQLLLQFPPSPSQSFNEDLF